MNDAILRENLVELLRGENAHAGAARVLEGVSADLRNVRPGPELHSVWEELEHLRIAQEDILRYTLDAGWQSPRWPDGYWPDRDGEIDDDAWNASVSGFFSDLEELIALANNGQVDLTAKIPHGEGRTYLRQLLLTADHNAYHIGQIVQTRKALGDWPG
ncbi:MAG TPA: DinB family protein [Blastocatellia bacterium]|jgi:hypothetical protein|nr:DinB family protein [Blastocatellia bacterium]